MGIGPPSPLFFGSAHYKGVKGEASVSADSKGIISTKTGQEHDVYATADSAGLSKDARRVSTREEYLIK